MTTETTTQSRIARLATRKEATMATFTTCAPCAANDAATQARLTFGAKSVEFAHAMRALDAAGHKHGAECAVYLPMVAFA